ncbi:hypothetical protein AVEN_219180-1 [Araneus ventricosus]|uniref:Uncharacterized protein n=1 Tax=Araneus ventricosus TaxID=182803 RepID=A0A4Y2HWF1_ARAVE|nr:hypothetical protein AVEN_219180-1 [Araneus ventricosus]
METRNASVVDSLMNNTYPLQRLDANKKIPLTLIKENWQFLCVRKYMLLHAEKLVGFPIAEKFEEAVRDRIPEVFSFLRSVATKRLRSVDLELQHQHLNYIPALAAYFEEDCNVIFKTFEVNKSLHEVQNEAPVTPFIAGIGNPYQLDPVCTVFVEKTPLEPMIALNDAIHTWFSSFYILNLVYPEECCATLEYVMDFNIWCQ